MMKRRVMLPRMVPFIMLCAARRVISQPRGSQEMVVPKVPNAWIRAVSGGCCRVFELNYCSILGSR